jgi:hypothetical protein
MKSATFTVLLFFIAFVSAAQENESAKPALLNRIHSTKKVWKKIPSRVFVSAGAAFNGLKITGDDSYHETHIDHKPKISPVLQFGVKFPVNSTNGALFISPAIRFYSFKSNGSIDLQSGLANYKHESVVKTGLIVNPMADIGFHFINKPAFKFYVAAGLGFSFLSQPGEIETTSFSTPPLIVAASKPNPMIFVFNTEAGIDIGAHVGLLINYQPPAEMENFTNKSVKFSTLQAGLRWYFR